MKLVILRAIFVGVLGGLLAGLLMHFSTVDNHAIKFGCGVGVVLAVGSWISGSIRSRRLEDTHRTGHSKIEP